jgi:DNA polymerase-4
MEISLNKAVPTIMHIDLNSCFATVEQQAHPHLRGKPIVIAAYPTPGGCILAPSIEAKKIGIKTGMRVREGKEIFPDLIVRTPDTALIRDVHQKFKRICLEYSPNVIPKSIDEVVMNFSKTPALIQGLINIGREIKRRFKEEIGEWISCIVGISTNRFLAKTAASLHKPDGLDVIDYKNLKNTYEKLTLTDLTGINTRVEFRLNQVGIFTPLDFLKAPDSFLRKVVFKSIVGHYWYLRLRGFEVDDFESTRKSFGQDYALAKKTKDLDELKKIIMKLCEKMGRRLRAAENCASGFHLGLVYDDWSYWHKGHKFKEYSYTTQELFSKIMGIFFQQPLAKTVAKIAVSCFDLQPISNMTLNLFETDVEKKRSLSKALDKINDRYGEYVIYPGLMINMKNKILDRIAFGKSGLL